MKNVIIDINSKPSTIYYIGSTGDDKAYSLSFLNLPLDGTEYAITWQNNEETLKLQPLNNNEFVVTNKYTKTAGIINIQLYSKKDGEWIAYSGILRLMLTNSIQEVTPEPTPTETPEYIIYKAYDVNGYVLNGLGPCIIQNEKTDVNIKIDGHDLTEIDCLGGQLTLIKKVDGTDGIIGYFTDDDGRCNYLEVSGGLIVNGFADGDNHWGLLSVSADNKTLTAVDFVNGLKTDKEATENNDVVNKGYVDTKDTETLNSSKGYTDEKIAAMATSGGLEIKETITTQNMDLDQKEAGVYILQYYNQDARFFLTNTTSTSYYIFGGLVYLYKKLSESSNGEYIGFFYGNEKDDKSGLNLIRLRNNNGALEGSKSPTGPLSDFV